MTKNHYHYQKQAKESRHLFSFLLELQEKQLERDIQGQKEWLAEQY